MRPWRLGLTGGIGSGKSTVARLLVARGAVLVDADALSRAATASGGAAMPAIRQAFGDELLTAAGALDRERMRALAFADPGARARLEAIVHPVVQAHGEALARQAAAAGSHWLVHDIPLLAETAGRSQRTLDAVLVVDCSVETQVARTVARDGLAPEAVLRTVAAQATRTARRALADLVIYNEGIDTAALEREADAVASIALQAAGYHAAQRLPPDAAAARTPPP